MRILIIAPSLAGGGAEDSMAQLFGFFREAGFEVKFVGINRHQSDPKSENGNFFSLGRDSRAGLIETFKFGHKLRDLVKGFQPDAIILNCEISELIALLLPSSRMFVVEHTTRPWIGRRLLGVIVRSLLTLRRASWITVTRGQEKIWPMKSPCVYIPNPVALFPSRVKRKYDLVYVGRLNKWKHPELVVQLGQELSANTAIIGDGPLLDVFLRSDFGERITFKGFQEEPWREIGVDDLVIFPSEFEGDGKTVVEAIIRGNPILLLDNPDLRRFNLHESSYFSSYDALKSKVYRYLNEGPEEFRPEEATQIALRRCRDLRAIGKQWRDALQS